jgi:hypothetical protein
MISKYPFEISLNIHPQSCIIPVYSHCIILTADSASFFRLQDKIKNPNLLRPFTQPVSAPGFTLLGEEGNRKQVSRHRDFKNNVTMDKVPIICHKLGPYKIVAYKSPTTELGVFERSVRNVFWAEAWLFSVGNICPKWL